MEKNDNSQLDIEILHLTTLYKLSPFAFGYEIATCIYKIKYITILNKQTKKVVKPC